MRRLLFLLFLVALPLPVAGQEVVALKKEIQRFGDPTEDTMDLIGELSQNLWKEFLLVQTPEERKAEVARILVFSRGNLQTGGASGSSGSTSAVVSPLLPAIFGAALENGAITRTLSGTTISLKVNPAKLICASKPGNAAAVALRDGDACQTRWSRLGLVASFDTARDEAAEGLPNLQALNSQFSELAVRFEILNRRDVTLDRVRGEAEKWQKRAEELHTGIHALDLSEPQELLEEKLTTLLKTDEWTNGTSEERVTLVTAIVRSVVDGAVAPAGPANALRTAWLEALDAYDRLETAIANAAVVTADYSFQRPDLTTEAIGEVVPAGERPPSVHTGRVVFAKGWPDRRLDVTANASVSFFGDKRAGMPGYLRDIRAGVEGKFKLRTLANYGAPTLSFAGLYVFLNQEPLGLGLTAFNQAQIEARGHIGLFQTKLEFPAASNTIRIPLSLTVSNRTELIQESEVRGQVGISFNLDALFAEP